MVILPIKAFQDGVARDALALHGRRILTLPPTNRGQRYVRSSERCGISRAICQP